MRRLLLVFVLALSCGGAAAAPPAAQTGKAAPATAHTLAPGQYARSDGAITHRIELRADGTGTAATQSREGRYLVITRFNWKVEGDRLVQSKVSLQNNSGEFVAREDTALELRNIAADGFDTRARPNMPWVSWKRQAWKK